MNFLAWALYVRSGTCYKVDIMQLCSPVIHKYIISTLSMLSDYYASIFREKHHVKTNMGFFSQKHLFLVSLISVSKFYSY